MEEGEDIITILNQLTPLQIVAIALAVVFLAIGLRLVFRKSPSHLTAFTGEAGNVLVSRKALQTLIKQACLLDDWVEAARPVVRVKGVKVSAKVEVRLSAPDNLKDVCERLQERVTELLQKSLSFDQIGDIQIVVKSFNENHESQRGVAVPALNLPASAKPVEPAFSPDVSPEISSQTGPASPESAPSDEEKQSPTDRPSDDKERS